MELNSENILLDNIKIESESKADKNSLQIKKEKINKRSNAGGSNTSKNGNIFEADTDNQIRLIEFGYIKKSFTKNIKNTKKTYDYYLLKFFNDKTIVFAKQSGFKIYMKKKYNIELFRFPDEAYIIEYNDGRRIIKILEKKSQNKAGSTETKLWASSSLRREYEIVLGCDYDIHYALCINTYLQKLLESSNMKYKILKEILYENDIDILFGNEKNYFIKLDAWLNKL